jgi:hypothetical protein
MQKSRRSQAVMALGLLAAGSLAVLTVKSDASIKPTLVHWDVFLGVVAAGWFLSWLITREAWRKGLWIVVPWLATLIVAAAVSWLVLADSGAGSTGTAIGTMSGGSLPYVKVFPAPKAGPPTPTAAPDPKAGPTTLKVTPVLPLVKGRPPTETMANWAKAQKRQQERLLRIHLRKVHHLRNRVRHFRKLTWYWQDRVHRTRTKRRPGELRTRDLGELRRAVKRWKHNRNHARKKALNIEAEAAKEAAAAAERLRQVVQQQPVNQPTSPSPTGSGSSGGGSSQQGSSGGTQVSGCVETPSHLCPDAAPPPPPAPQPDPPPTGGAQAP